MGCSTDPLQELLPESVVVRAPCWRQGVPGERLGSISTGRSGPSPARLCPSPVLKALQPLQASLQSLTTWWHGKPVLFSRNFSGVNLQWSLLGLLLPALRMGWLCCPCGGCGVGSSCPHRAPQVCGCVDVVCCASPASQVPGPLRLMK